MKHKTLKRVLCFLLALVVVASMPLDIHANAVAVAPWAVYALITYMAAVGITFTVTGGVDAMVKAVQDKVDEYEKTVSLPLPIWVVIEEGTKLVPPPSGGGPNWNPNRGKFFFTANATAAITAFITWLVSDGGWTAGETTNVSTGSITFDAVIDGVDTVAITSNVTLIDTTDYGGTSYSKYRIDSMGTFLPFDFTADPYYISPDYFYTEKGGQVSCFVGYNKPYSTDYTLNLNVQQGSYSNINLWPTTSLAAFGYGSYPADFVENAIGLNFVNHNGMLFVCLVLNDGNCLTLRQYYWNVNPIFLQSTVDIMTPEEIPQLQPSTQQGVYIDTSTDAETLEELAEDIKTQFEETGIIPRPVPEVITDPDFAPQPSPVPTPPVYEDVDGLGLPSLAETMKNKFPFCLPYDLGRVFEIFYAEPVTPYWEVDLFATLGNRVPFVGDSSFTIDLAEYEDLGTISRWMTTIGYTLLLILITRQTIKW